MIVARCALRSVSSAGSPAPRLVFLPPPFSAAAFQASSFWLVCGEASNHSFRALVDLRCIMMVGPSLSIVDLEGSVLIAIAGETRHWRSDVAPAPASGARDCCL